MEVCHTPQEKFEDTKEVFRSHISKLCPTAPPSIQGWLLLLKIEISSIVHCCFSISQNELKFELQLHGKE